MSAISKELVRPATDDEVDHFAEHGWVTLPSLISPETSSSLLKRAKELMGEDATGHEVRAGRDHKADFFEVYSDPSNDDELFFSLAHSRELGRNGARLLGRDTPMRLFYNNLYPKLPQSKGGKATDAHQDWLQSTFDRLSLIFWIALDHLVPEQGLVHFRSGSAKLGPLDGTFPTDEEMEARWPRLKSCPPSTATPMNPGDATVHHSMTVHSAPPNTTDRTRWAMGLLLFPGDARHRQMHRLTKDLDLPLGAVVEHPNFPIVYDPAS